MTAFALGLVAQGAEPDALSLPIGTPGAVQALPNQIVATRSGKAVTLDDLAAAADGTRWVYVGESHDNADHHKMQAAVIDALIKRGRNVVVGFEMFTRPVQQNLNGWTLGWYTDEEFVAKSDWKTQWGFDYALYKPIFDTIKANRLPMVALNVPRDWVRTASRQGYDALPADAKSQLPEMFLGNKDHRSIFEAMVGGHAGGAVDGMYRGQVMWDEGMADSALKYMDEYPRSPKTVMVVVAGSGHVMYEQGINWRIERRTKENGVTLVMIDGTESRKVSKGLADFVYMAPPAKSNGGS